MKPFLLFDCDGVLVDTEMMAARVMTKWLSQQGCQLNEWDFITRYTGKTFGGIFKLLVEKGELQHNSWNDTIIREIEEEIYASVKPVSGISDCLSELKAYEKAVVSNSRASMVRQGLTTTNLHSHLDLQQIFSSEMVDKPKPSPLVYMLALEKSSKHSSETIAIEDSKSGVTAAVKANIKTIGFCGASHQQEGHDKQLLEAGASTIAYHAHDIPGLIKELSRS